MARKDMKKALGASLKAEEQAVRSRFEKAETVLAGTSEHVRSGVDRQNSNGRVVRDSFTMPTDDYDLISAIRKRCLKQGVSATKSEVLRAGLTALGAMPDKDLVKVIEGLLKVKTGRPATG